MKDEIKNLMAGKPTDFVRSIRSTLDEKKQVIADNKFFIFSEELNSSLGAQKLNEEAIEEETVEEGIFDRFKKKQAPYDRDEEDRQRKEVLKHEKELYTDKERNAEYKGAKSVMKQERKDTAKDRAREDKGRRELIKREREGK